MPHQFIKDKYSKVRGGRSKFVHIHCVGCDEILFSYQKDGPGSLKRCYLDRISEAHVKIAESSKIECIKCNKDIGYPMLYKKENSPAFKMLWGNFKIERVEST